jgi:hypothetical protein
MYYAIAPDAKRLVNSLLNLFSASLKSDATLRGDKKKLSQRLALRSQGACCVGFRCAKGNC